MIYIQPRLASSSCQSFRLNFPSAETSVCTAKPGLCILFLVLDIEIQVDNSCYKTRKKTQNSLVKKLVMLPLLALFFSLQRKLDFETMTFVKKLHDWVCSSVVEFLSNRQKALGEYANCFVLVVTTYQI